MSSKTDPKEFGRLLRPLLENAAGYAVSLMRSRHDAEDAVQQAALQGLEKFATYDPARPFKAWWFTIVRNCCMDALRRRRATVSLDGYDQPAKTEPDPNRWEDLAQAIDHLTPQHSEILRLRYFGELSYHELASALDIPEGTVMSRLHFARKTLMDKMKGEEL